MTYFHPAAVTHRRKLYMRHDAWRFAAPGTPEAKMPGWADPSATRVRLKKAQDEEAQAEEAQVRVLRESHERAREMLAEIKYELAWRRLCRKYGYNPDQPRDELGRWTSGVDGESNADASDESEIDAPSVQLAAMSWAARRDMIFGQRDLFEVEGGLGGNRGGSSLPPYKGGSTAGVLRSPGTQDVELVSGEGGPASRMPPKSPGFDAYTSEHVEGHAAAAMRELKINEGTLYINHPNGPCPNCDSLLNRMLPSGARLEVIWPSGAKSYEGVQP